MFAEVDFGAISGVFRFERQGGEDGQTKNDDDNADEEDDSEEESDDEEEDKRSSTPEAFYLRSTTQPSANSPAWYYRWRGEEQGEGEIELEPDENLYKITFSRPKGTKLAGTFGGGAFGDCELTGIKVRTGGPPNIDIAEEWANRSESAHEMAQIDRWY